MCGISVIVALDQKKNLKKGIDVTSPSEGLVNGSHRTSVSEKLDESLDLLAHRGPDSRGQWVSEDGRVALGHVRLAIVDLSPNGAQPFHDKEGSIHAVVNGELYDADRIRTDMIRETGYVFNGHSDSEIVVALYKQNGISFLRHLRGEFALCLYDSRVKYFVAARDRYGIKPLFWTFLDGRLLVASEAKAFLPLGWKPKWDVKCLMDDGWRHDQRTPFQGVNKVRPGHYLTCNAFGSIEMRQYWDLNFPNKAVADPRTEEEIVEGVRSRLLDAVRLRLRADVPVGVYLSGGVDSSAVAGMMCHLFKEQGKRMGIGKGLERMTCFTIGFDEASGMNESGIAERTAQHLGVTLIKKHMNEEEIAKRFEDAVWHSEHQNYDLNFVGKFALSEAPRELGFKAILTGEGADEVSLPFNCVAIITNHEGWAKHTYSLQVFGGYPAFLPDFLREPDHAWPYSNLTDEERQKRLTKAELAAAEFYKGRALKLLSHGASLADRQLNNISSHVSLASYTFPLFAPWTSSYGESDPRVTIANNVDGRVQERMLKKWHPLHSALYIWTKGNLANVLLACLGDRSEMAHSVEGRLPFLDHELTGYVNEAPPSLKIRYSKENGFSEKWLLREAVKPFILEEVYNRKKHGYAAPTRWPRDGPLHKLFQRLVTRENVERLGYVHWSRVEDLVHKAFVEHDTVALRCANVVAQWVVLSQRFGIETATPVPDST